MSLTCSRGLASGVCTCISIGTIASKINVTPKGVRKFATAKIECNFVMGKRTPSEVTFILLAIVPGVLKFYLCFICTSNESNKSCHLFTSIL